MTKEFCFSAFGHRSSDRPVSVIAAGHVKDQIPITSSARPNWSLYVPHYVPGLRLLPYHQRSSAQSNPSSNTVLRVRAYAIAMIYAMYQSPSWEVTRIENC